VICKYADRNLICGRFASTMFTAPSTIPTLHIVDSVNAVRGMLVPKSETRLAAKRGIQARQREWLQGIVKATGDTLSQIAAKAQVSDTTLSRIVNNPAYEGVLSAVTITRITGTYQLPGPEEYAGRRPMLGGFAEAERFDADNDPDGITPLVQAMLGTRPMSDAWRLKTEALEQVGYLPGDVLIVDTTATPLPQDVVCAQVYDWQRGGAQTVWRVFDPPFLVGASRDRTAHKPLLVDNDRVIVKGVVDKMVRPHRLSATR
jgi:SOS-response transcriptional repressor LexA